MMNAGTESEQGRVTVDFRMRVTGAEWDEGFNRFWKRATPLWFQSLEWVLILGVLTFIHQEAGGILLGVVCGLSHAAFAFYVFALLVSVEFRGLPILESKRSRAIISLTATAAIAVTVYLALHSLVVTVAGQS